MEVPEGMIPSGGLSAMDFRPLLSGDWEQLTAQHWGILAGCATYVVTVFVVLVLMVKGGTFQRIKEQAEVHESRGAAALAPRQLELYDELLAASAALPLKPQLPIEKQGSREEAVLRGKHVELRPFVAAEHLEKLFDISHGKACFAHGHFDPNLEIWRFLEAGPFVDAKAMGEAPLMSDPADGLRLVVIDTNTRFVVGMVSLLRNCPTALRVELADVWLTPAFQRTHVHTDLLVTVLDHLTQRACYRRVEWQCDAQDTRARKAAERAGFVLEGVLRKHQVVRKCNRDTALYSMTNSDWRDGARALLSAKLRPPSGIAGPARAKPPREE